VLRELFQAQTDHLSVTKGFALLIKKLDALASAERLQDRGDLPKTLGNESFRRMQWCQDMLAQHQDELLQTLLDQERSIALVELRLKLALGSLSLAVAAGACTTLGTPSLPLPTEEPPVATNPINTLPPPNIVTVTSESSPTTPPTDTATATQTETQAPTETAVPKELFDPLLAFDEPSRRIGPEPMSAPKLRDMIEGKLDTASIEFSYVNPDGSNGEPLRLSVAEVKQFLAQMETMRADAADWAADHELIENTDEAKKKIGAKLALGADGLSSVILIQMPNGQVFARTIEWADGTTFLATTVSGYAPARGSGVILRTNWTLLDSIPFNSGNNEQLTTVTIPDHGTYLAVVRKNSDGSWSTRSVIDPRGWSADAELEIDDYLIEKSELKPTDTPVPPTAAVTSIPTANVKTPEVTQVVPSKTPTEVVGNVIVTGTELLKEVSDACAQYPADKVFAAGADGTTEKRRNNNQKVDSYPFTYVVAGVTTSRHRVEGVLLPNETGRPTVSGWSLASIIGCYSVDGKTNTPILIPIIVELDDGRWLWLQRTPQDKEEGSSEVERILRERPSELFFNCEGNTYLVSFGENPNLDPPSQVGVHMISSGDYPQLLAQRIPPQNKK
jgi:hypothetical protein